MTLEKEIRDLLAPLEMTVAQHVYTGAAERYIVFETMFVPDGYADDNAQYERVLVNLYLHTPMTEDTTKLRRQIQRLCAEHGWPWPSMTDVSSDAVTADGAKRRLLFETQTVLGVEDDGTD